MKYIKTFESLSFDNIKDTIIDIFSDMIDDGLIVEVFNDESIVSIMITYTLPPNSLFSTSSGETKKFISTLWDLNLGKIKPLSNFPIIKRIEDTCGIKLTIDCTMGLTTNGGISTLRFETD